MGMPGFSAGGSKSKNKEKSSEAYSGVESMTPSIYPALQQPLNKVGHDIGSILDWESRPEGGAWGSDFIAPASTLQNQAFAQAGQLGGWRGLAGQSQDLANRVAGAGPLTAAAAQATAPGMPTARGYTAAEGVARGYAAPQLGGASQAQAATIGGFEPVQAASLLDGLERYYNPYRQEVVDATLADFDVDAGRQDAAERARRASIGNAFNNSGVAVADALREGERARARTATGAGLRFQAMEGAFNRSGQDAAGRQAASAQNSAQSAQRAMAQAELEQRVGLRNADAADAWAVQQAGFDERAGQYGAEAANRTMLDRLGRQDAASQFGAAADNTAGAQAWHGLVEQGRFNAGEANRVALANQAAGLQQQSQQLQAAGLLGDLSRSYGAQELADLGLLGELGGEQRAIDHQKRQSYLTLLQQMGGLLAGQPFGATTGQTSSKSGTSSGTRKSTGTTISGYVGRKE